ncbi:MAG: 50S ribosomal protein L30 [Firmicutes bacterium]|nr:50S ribosomal protein L30 [Bacillota bacterium]
MPRKKVPVKQKQLQITWKHSAIGRAEVQKRTIAALGLRRLNQTVTHLDTPAIRGMVNKVRHLVDVKEL